MHLAAGAFAQHLNRRKGFEGLVWEHPYQCTIPGNPSKALPEFLSLDAAFTQRVAGTSVEWIPPSVITVRKKIPKLPERQVDFIMRVMVIFVHGELEFLCNELTRA